jgi:DNA-binding LacI/PurR family transcriptional regulator
VTTIKDVAREAGVSVTTVSHVFSGRRKVAEKTAQRVLAVAGRLGYQPDAAARKLATGRSTTVGLFFEMSGEVLLLNPFFSELLVELSAAAAEFGFTFMLLPHDQDDARLIHAGSLAGAVIVDPTPENRWIPQLVREGTRVVTIGRYLGGVETSWVDNDHRAAMLAVVDHLADRGFQHLALLSVRHRISYLTDIEQAFSQACLTGSLAGELVYASDLSDRSARLVARELLQRTNAPDAIIGAIDHMALGVVHAAEELGLSVPHDLAVVGAGDTVLSRHSEPQLTTVQVEPRRLAREALGILRDFWHDPGAPDRNLLFPATLLVRASSDR